MRKRCRLSESFWQFDSSSLNQSFVCHLSTLKHTLLGFNLFCILQSLNHFTAKCQNATANLSYMLYLVLNSCFFHSFITYPSCSGNYRLFIHLEHLSLKNITLPDKSVHTSTNTRISTLFRFSKTFFTTSVVKNWTKPLFPYFPQGLLFETQHPAHKQTDGNKWQYYLHSTLLSAVIRFLGHGSCHLASQGYFTVIGFYIRATVGTIVWLYSSSPSEILLLSVQSPGTSSTSSDSPLLHPWW